jgi:hypothetical protein
MGFWNAQLFKKIARHFFIVVLAGVNQAVVQTMSFVLLLFNSFDDGRYLHEVGPCASNNGNFHVYLIFLILFYKHTETPKSPFNLNEQLGS